VTSNWPYAPPERMTEAEAGRWSFLGPPAL